MFGFLCIVVGCILGNILGNLISQYLISRKINKSLFTKNDFIKEFDDDFFSDDIGKSITDIEINKEE